VQCEWGIDDSTISLISTVVFVGMLVGAIGAGRVSDVLGRRQGYLATTTLCGVCGVLTAFAPDIYSLLVLRGLVGIGIGGAAAGLSLYAEFLPRNMRGRRLVRPRVVLDTTTFPNTSCSASDLLFRFLFRWCLV
jgi:MFS family permease